MALNSPASLPAQSISLSRKKVCINAVWKQAGTKGHKVLVCSPRCPYCKGTAYTRNCEACRGCGLREGGEPCISCGTKGRFPAP